VLLVFYRACQDVGTGELPGFRCDIYERNPDESSLEILVLAFLGGRDKFSIGGPRENPIRKNK
jgi:hypothetical protein